MSALKGEAWTEIRLSEVCRIKHGYAFKGEYFSDTGEYIVLTPGNFLEGGGFKLKDAGEKYYVGEIPREYVLRHGDLIVAMTEQSEGLLGSAASVPEDDRFLHNQRLGLVVELKGDKISKEFLYYLLNSGYVRRQIRATATGLKIRHTAPERIARVAVKLPPLRSQRKIASVLSAYDQTVETNNRRIEILEEIARRAYTDLFVASHGAGRVARGAGSHVRVAADGWKVVPLSAVLTVLETGSRPKGGIANFTEGVASIGAESIVGIGRYNYSKTRFIPESHFRRMRQGVLESRDVLVYKDGGKPGDFQPHVSIFGDGFPFDEMAINSHVYRLRVPEAIGQEYLYFYVSSEAMLDWMHRHGSGVAIPSIARRDLMRMPFVIPDVATITRFLSLAVDIVSEIFRLAKQSRLASEARTFLAPRLLAGELDVSDIDMATEGLV